jgi:hypothetical protein
VARNDHDIASAIVVHIVPTQIDEFADVQLRARRHHHFDHRAVDVVVHHD